MIPYEDWKAVNLPGFRHSIRPRTFKFSFKKFKKRMRDAKLKDKSNFTVADRVTKLDMEAMHGGIYWPTTDEGLIALPYSSKKFNFKDWVEDV